MQERRKRIVPDMIGRNREVVLLWGVAAFCLMLFILEWVNTEGLTGFDLAQYGVIATLTLVLPTCPVPVALVLLSLNLVLAIGPFNGFGYVQGLPPMLLAAAVLGARWGRPFPSGVFAALCVMAYWTEMLFDFPPSPAYTMLTALEDILPLAMAWAVGSIIRWARGQERRMSEQSQAARLRERQLMLMHVLHDSVANDLVYAISRCNMLVEEQSLADGARKPDMHVIAQVNEITTVLEQSLQELRSRVITPMKHELLQDEDGTPSDMKLAKAASSMSAVALTQTAVVMSGKRLREAGFVGVPQIDGNLENITDGMADFLTNAVRELGGNMMKHGKAGPFTLIIEATAAGSIIIIASNMMRHSDGGTSQSTRKADFASSELSDTASSGLGILRMETEKLGGVFNVTEEDDEWSVYINVPAAKSKTEQREHLTDPGSESINDL